MSMRSVVPVLLMLLAAMLPSVSPAVAQAAASRQERSLARQWATIHADSAAVDRLFQATVRRGGPVLFDAVLRAAHDAARPRLVRVYGEGTLVLSLVVEPNGIARSASVEGAGLRPEFEAATLRVVERMRFTPARLDGARVAVRVAVPVRVAFGSEYPRVPDP